MLFFADSLKLRSRRRRTQVQLVFEFVERGETTELPAVVWEELNPNDRVAVVTMLARLMAKALDAKEAGNE